MTDTSHPPDRPLAAIAAMTAYVARWPFRHVHGSDWLRERFSVSLTEVSSRTIARTYGLYFRDSESPPKVEDLRLVTLMQTLILATLMALIWLSWTMTDDYVLPALMAFSVFHLVPSRQDFLTEGRLADRVPSWLTPITGALSFVVSLPGMLIALPAAIVWGVIGTLKLKAANGGIS